MFASSNLSSRKSTQRLVSGQPFVEKAWTYTNTLSAIGYSGIGSLLDYKKLQDDVTIGQNSDASCNCCSDDGYGNCNSCLHYFYCGPGLPTTTTFPNPGWYDTATNSGFKEFATAGGSSCGGIYCYDGAGSYDCCNISSIPCWYQLSGGSGNGDMTLAGIKSDNTLWTWGYNENFGTMGDGTKISKSSMVQIGSDFIDVRGGDLFFIALKSDGTLWSWGAGGVGSLGIGAAIDKSSPTQIGSQTYWSGSFSCGSGHVMAVSNDGKLWGWGANAYGQLGNNTSTYTSSPIQIGSDTNWKSVFCGDQRTFAIKKDNTLWGWGLNTSYELGVGNTANRSSPVQIGSAMNWKQVYCPEQQGYAIAMDGTMWAWGINPLGLPMITSYSLPTVIGSIRNKIHAYLPQACYTDGLYVNYTNYYTYSLPFIDVAGNVLKYSDYNSTTSSLYTGRNTKKIVLPRKTQCNSYLIFNA